MLPPQVAEAYWSAIYDHLRYRFGLDPLTAEDTVQGFFVRVIERDLLAKYDASRGSFDAYLRRCVENYAIDQHRRGTGQRRVLIRADVDLLVEDMRATVDREALWQIVARGVERLLAQLEAAGKPLHAELFRMLHLADERPTYQVAAAALGIRVTDATNWLHVARRELRRIVLEMLAE